MLPINLDQKAPKNFRTVPQLCLFTYNLTQRQKAELFIFKTQEINLGKQRQNQFLPAATC